MADTDTEIDTEIDTDAAPAGGGLMKKLMLGGGAVLLLGIGIFAGPAIQNMISAPADEVAESEAEEAAEEVAEPSGPELYQGLHPAMVVNFRDEFGEPHYMQLEMEVMARDQDVINAVREHTPLIRNNLILLFSSLKYEDVTTREGKEKMLAAGLAEIQSIMEPRVGKPNAEALYFTTLIIQ